MLSQVNFRLMAKLASVYPRWQDSRFTSN